MSLLSQASLVVVPSGYKEDKVYSVKPTDGSGDLTFTRASDGTRVNSQGLVERVPWNLLQYSEDFTNAYWSKDVGATVDSNVATAPNGTTTADRLNFAGAGQAVYHIQTFSGANTFSVYLKAEGANIGKQIYLEVGVTSTVTLTGEWQRFEVNADNAGTVAIKRNTSGQASSVLAWGIQVNEGSLKPYFPTTDRQNVPRLDYSNGCPSLLLEPQRTNLYPYSEQLNQWNCTHPANVTANYAVSPNGYQNADRVQFVAGMLVYQSGTGSAGENTLSVYAKATNGTSAKFRFFANNATLFSSDQTATGEWQRFTFTYTYSAVTAGLARPTTNVDDVIFWGFQHEIGSYPTSYIPTTSASVTRVADAASKTGISSLIGQTEGTIFVEANLSDVIDPSNIRGILEINDGTTDNRISIYRGANDLTLNSLIFESALAQSIITASNISGRVKIGFAYSASDTALFINGTLIGTDTSSTIPACSDLDLGIITNRTDRILGDGINQIVLFKTRLTNAELASLTTL